MTPRAARALVGPSLLTLLAIGCGGDDDYNLPTSYEITFPSNEVAIVTDSLRVFVVDATGRERDVCNELFAARTAGMKFSRVLTQSTMTVCDAVAAGPVLDVSFGVRAIFVAATSVDTVEADYLLGCAVAYVGTNADKPRIDLALAAGVQDPQKIARPVDCRSIADRCAKRCTK